VTANATIGVDIGGTFTDVVCRRPGEATRIVKIPSTPDDPARAVIQAADHIAAQWGVTAAEIARFAHGTTVATNAVIERAGATIGLLATKGFRDTLEIGRQMRQNMYGLILEPETPIFLAPGAYRREVRERISASGEVIEALNEADVIAAVDALVADGIEALAVCLLFSFVNPAHEKRIKQLVNERHPQLDISLSCEVDPAFREYERTVVTAFDAYIKPTIDSYLGALEVNLREAGLATPLLIMQSRGGLAASVVARQRPVRLFLSGPAAGVIGGQMTGVADGIHDLITVDVGGTSCDIALISAAKPIIRAEGAIAGYPVRVPMVDVNAIGAGGGSIAWIDAAGGIRVGPQSAGAQPGPACYGQGGEDATVTDASLILGYLNPDYFAGGGQKLSIERARAAVAAKLAGPLGLSVEAAVLGIHRVVNAQMSEGIKLVSIRQGLDPRDFCLLPLGGAGALHACALAAELAIARILVPRHPGVLSAAGLLCATVQHEISAAFNRPMTNLAVAAVSSELDGLDRRCDALMDAEGIAPAAREIQYFADVCYIGQSYHLEIPLDMASADPLSDLYRDFMAVHDRVYGHAAPTPARIVNLRSVHQEAAGAQDEPPPPPAGGEARKGGRKIIVPECSGPVDAVVYERAALAAGSIVEGPAIIEQEDTTILIAPGWRGQSTASGALLLESIQP
jgi:N-methylhydantoinase A/oxoprolinase/acetone carboxylase beta subunit